MREFEITRPDDWHLHLRDGDAMADVVPHTAAIFGRAIVMPNLKPPVVNQRQALVYKSRIQAAVPEGVDFEPLMTIYLTDHTLPQEIIEAKKGGAVYGAKLYPAGATTNSDSGVTDVSKMDHVFAAMSEVGLPLLLHGEVTTHGVDIFDREHRFLDDVLVGIMKRHPWLKLVFEHITTKRAAEFVAQGPPRLAATITAHHLLENRNSMLAGGIRPHLYCLPILKRESDRRALLEAATSGNPKFFLGTDSAPHPVGAKEAECGCAGCFTAHGAMGLYAEAFDTVGAIDRLEGFASHYGADFYGLPRNTTKIRLKETPVVVPRRLTFGGDEVQPFRAGEQVLWHAEPVH